MALQPQPHIVVDHKLGIVTIFGEKSLLLSNSVVEGVNSCMYKHPPRIVCLQTLQRQTRNRSFSSSSAVRSSTGSEVIWGYIVGSPEVIKLNVCHMCIHVLNNYRDSFNTDGFVSVRTQTQPLPQTAGASPHQGGETECLYYEQPLGNRPVPAASRALS